jgi:quinohemoprotein ethanol dehydrogenase
VAVRPEVDKARGVKACCDVVNRGVAFWKGKYVRRHHRRSADRARCKNRQEIWSRRRLIRNRTASITGFPRVVKDLVIIGNGGAEFGARGYVTAYHADTGKQALAFLHRSQSEGRARQCRERQGDERTRL